MSEQNNAGRNIITAAAVVMLAPLALMAQKPTEVASLNSDALMKDFPRAGAETLRVTTPKATALPSFDFKANLPKLHFPAVSSALVGTGGEPPKPAVEPKAVEPAAAPVVASGDGPKPAGKHPRLAAVGNVAWKIIFN